MSFTAICMAVSFLIQLAVLAYAEKRFWHLISPCIMCLPFICGMAWYAVTKTSDFVFGWTDSIMFLLILVIAVLLGCALAGVVYKWTSQREN